MRKVKERVVETPEDLRGGGGGGGGAIKKIDKIRNVTSFNTILKTIKIYLIRLTTIKISQFKV